MLTIEEQRICLEAARNYPAKKGYQWFGNYPSHCYLKVIEEKLLGDEALPAPSIALARHRDTVDFYATLGDIVQFIGDENPHTSYCQLLDSPESWCKVFERAMVKHGKSEDRITAPPLEANRNGSHVS